MTKFIFLNSVTKNQTLSQILDKEELDQFIEKLTEYEYQIYKDDEFNFDSKKASAENESEKKMLQAISNQFKNLSNKDKDLYNLAISQSNAINSTITKLEDLLVYCPVEILNELLPKTKFHDGVIRINDQILNTKMSKITENEPKFLTHVSNYIFNDIISATSSNHSTEHNLNAYNAALELNYAWTHNQIFDFIKLTYDKKVVFASAFSKNSAINIFNKTLKEVLDNHFSLELLNTFFDDIHFVK